MFVAKMLFGEGEVIAKADSLEDVKALLIGDGWEPRVMRTEREPGSRRCYNVCDETGFKWQREGRPHLHGGSLGVSITEYALVEEVAA